MRRNTSATSGGAATSASSARVAGLAARLTARDRWLLRMLDEHRVLTTTHLYLLGWAAGMRKVQSRARILYDYRVVDRFRPLLAQGEGTAPIHLMLGPAGAQVLAGERGQTMRQLGYPGSAKMAQAAHSVTLGHDVGANGLVCDIVNTPDLYVHTWWAPKRCARRFGHHTNPDALLGLATPATAPGDWSGSSVGRGPDGWWQMELFLEYDTGTEPLPRLADKLRGYADHVTSASDPQTKAPVAFWFTRPGREQTAREALAHTHARLRNPAAVPVFTACAPPGATGPDGQPLTAADRMWLPLRPVGPHHGRMTLPEITATHHQPHLTTLSVYSSVDDTAPAPPPQPPAATEAS